MALSPIGQKLVQNTLPSPVLPRPTLPRTQTSTPQYQQNTGNLLQGVKTGLSVVGQKIAQATQTLMPTRRAVFEDMENEARQSLLPTPQLRQQVAHRQGGFAPPTQDFNKFLDQKTIDPFGLVGSLASKGAKGIEKTSKPLLEKGFQGFTDLSTKVIEKLKGHTKVSKQFIDNLTNSPDLKQPERDLFRKMLAEEGDTVNVSDFANKVKSELLPLKRTTNKSPGYEGVTLPDELRGDVKKYSEHVYNSPVRTTAGDLHSGLGKNEGYFAHTRVEDMADGKTRRVNEVQSDLFQKDNLEIDANKLVNRMTAVEKKEYDKLDKFRYDGEGTLEQREAAWARMEEIRNEAGTRPGTVNKKLAQYGNPTAHFRVIREEVKQAAKDGKTKLQFPTGETAMKIEGLGTGGDTWYGVLQSHSFPLRPHNLKVGQHVSRRAGNEDWIITDVLGDGKFKAIPKSRYEYDSKSWMGTKEEHAEMVNAYSETFDISGKVDTNNPIYRFYEKEVSRYLKNKYGAQLVTDKQGVTWMEVSVGKDAKNAPVEAFGLAGGVETDDEGNAKFDPLTAGLGIAGLGMLRKSGALNAIDRLLAEGKIRVVSREGRDVYQVKKGSEWVNTRDESSAVKQLTEVKPKAVLPEALEQRKLELEVKKEVLADNPAKGLLKYVSKRGDSKGTLAEVTGKQASKTGIGIDVRAMDAGFENSEAAREAVEKYQKEKTSLTESQKQLREEIKTTRESQKKAPRPPAISRGEAKTLEESAQRLVEDLDVPPPYRPKSLEEIVTQTPVSQKVNALDWIRTPDRVLQKIGFGKEADLIRSQYEKYTIELPKNMEKIGEWSKQVGKPSSERIFKHLDGQEVILNPAETKVANEVKAYLSEWADRLNLPKDNRITNYITHLFDDQLIAKEFDDDLAKIIAEKIPGQVYDPFLEKRLGAKGYKQDVWAALDAYTKRATRKVHMDVALERIREKAGSSLELSNIEASQWKYLNHYVDRINMRPTNIDTALDNTIKSFLGYRFGQRPITNLSRTLRQMTYRGMLGGNLSSAMRNLSQGVNTYATLGERYTATGYVKMFSPSAQKELKEQGVLAQNFIEDRTLSTTRKNLERIDKALFVFFNGAERINRGAAYFGAKSKALAEGKTEEEAITFAKQIVRKTQFAYDAVDQPQLIASDLAKTLAQFSSYPIKQSEFLIEMAKDKNFVGLLRYAIAGTAFVYTVGKAFGMEPKELLPSFRFGVPPSLKFPAEVVKAGLDTPSKYGKPRDLETKLKDIGKSALGLIPGGIQMKKTYEGAQMIKDGAVYNKAHAYMYKQNEGILAKAQSLAFGKYSSQGAKDYFDKVQTPLQKLKAEKSAESTAKRDAFRPTYDKVQTLIKAGQTEEAQKIVDTLTPEQYESYKKIRTAERAKNTEQVRLQLELDPKAGVAYLRSLPKEEGMRILNLLTDEEYQLYESGK